ncbi:hypothetical protein Mp_7g04910 [Marchantia polymorpha subsp. ruderalis]|uniref:Uncharacterized protein n=2 Tax=Marchantia polymorpha TaxID=3197 RepID=A0AAF6BW89_MARPO|nr:hypothetical protein MARPO_0062s0035 [Marchantia polymorpha]BBN16273.1 hypothetical protein Mp_7g04910 [Marchantia polymorpha subsp. ruderalis]|eukprot:PTQ36609.1 hypothetical protein MARPO_0062s0035 [Marchantia polymorpha]
MDTITVRDKQATSCRKRRRRGRRRRRPSPTYKETTLCSAAAAAAAHRNHHHIIARRPPSPPPLAALPGPSRLPGPSLPFPSLLFSALLVEPRPLACSLSRTNEDRNIQHSITPNFVDLCSTAQHCTAPPPLPPAAAAAPAPVAAMSPAAAWLPLPLPLPILHPLDASRVTAASARPSVPPSLFPSFRPSLPRPSGHRVTCSLFSPSKSQQQATPFASLRSPGFRLFFPRRRAGRQGRQGGSQDVRPWGAGGGGGGP